MVKVQLCLKNFLHGGIDKPWNVSKNSFTGKYVGKDDFGNKYYKNKNDERWVIYSGNIEVTKITSDWYLWIHHTVNKIPNEEIHKFAWQKHSEIKLELLKAINQSKSKK